MFRNVLTNGREAILPGFYKATDSVRGERGFRRKTILHGFYNIDGKASSAIRKRGFRLVGLVLALLMVIGTMSQEVCAKEVSPWDNTAGLILDQIVSGNSLVL